MKTIAAHTLSIFVALTVASCKDNEERAEHELTAKGDHVAGTQTVKTATPKRSAYIERLVLCTVVGDGNVRLESRGPQITKSVQVWFYNYESSPDSAESRRGKELNVVLAPAETKSVDHGLGPQLETECEVTGVTLDDGHTWSNANLVYPTVLKRPRGGETDAVLARRSKAVVVARWEKNRKGAPMVLFRNSSERPLQLRQLNVRFVDKNGSTLQKMAVRSVLKLGPSESIVEAIAIPPAHLPKETHDIQILVASLQFSDGDREEILNLNQPTQ